MIEDRPTGAALYDLVDLPLPRFGFKVVNLYSSPPGQSPKIAKTANGELHLILCGNVYNDDFDVADSTRALLEAYQCEGQDLFKRLNGSFILILSDLKTQRLLLINDRTGSKPLLYTQFDHTFAFSNSLRSLLNLSQLPTGIDVMAMASFLANGFMLEGRTLLDAVRVLGPGQMLCLQDGQVQLQQYWTFRYAEKRRKQSRADLEIELHDLLMRAVARRTRGSLRFGLMLSGGYDSRVILECLLRQNRKEPLNTITWGESELSPLGDAAIGKILSAHIGSNHHFFQLNSDALPSNFKSFVILSDGRTDAVNNYPQALEAFEHARRELGLDFLLRGDEFFGGAANVTNEAQGLHRLNIHLFDHLGRSFKYLKKSMRKKLIDANHEQMSRIITECPYTDLHDRKDYFCYTQHMAYYLSPLTHLKERAIPVRCPHLDNDVLDFIMSIPTSLRLGKQLLRSTVRQLMPEMYSLGFAKSSSQINWNAQLFLKGNLQTYIRQVMLNETNGFTDYTNKKSLANFLNRSFQRSELLAPRMIKGTRKRLMRKLNLYELDPATEIFRLMILKLWIDEFLGGTVNLNV